MDASLRTAFSWPCTPKGPQIPTFPRTTVSCSSIPASWMMTRTRLGTAVTTVPLCTTPPRSTRTTMGRGTPAQWTLMGTVSGMCGGPACLGPVP